MNENSKIKPLFYTLAIVVTLMLFVLASSNITMNYYLISKLKKNDPIEEKMLVSNQPHSEVASFHKNPQISQSKNAIAEKKRPSRRQNSRINKVRNDKAAQKTILSKRKEQIRQASARNQKMRTNKKTSSASSKSAKKTKVSHSKKLASRKNPRIHKTRRIKKSRKKIIDPPAKRKSIKSAISKKSNPRIQKTRNYKKSAPFSRKKKSKGTTPPKSPVQRLFY